MAGRRIPVTSDVSRILDVHGSPRSPWRSRVLVGIGGGRIRTRQVPTDVRVGVGNPEGTAVRVLRRAGENLATMDTVAVDEIVENADEMITAKVEEEQCDEDEEEGQQPKVIRSPKAPTKAEREEHEATHLPCRSWCTHCLRGRKATPTTGC